MKYIRTQAGVYEVKNGKFLRDWSLDVEKYSKDFPVKFADTIEELCDVFVVVKDNEGVEFWKNFKLFKKYSHRIIENDFDNVYGAIWTDNGLIYVAKMNQEGELELWQD